MFKRWILVGAGVLLTALIGVFVFGIDLNPNIPSIEIGGDRSQYLSAQPISGRAPLPVTFTVTFPSAGFCNGGPVQLLEFGDGTYENIPYPCESKTHILTHQYPSRGTFVAEFSRAAGVEGGKSDDVDRITIQVD